MLRPHTLHLARLLLAFMSLLAMSSRAWSQDRVTLRPTAHISGNMVRVGDIAEVQGPPTLGDVVVIQDLRAELAPDSDAVTIELRRVRAALEKNAAINWGRLTLSGVACKIRTPPREPADANGTRAKTDADVRFQGPSMRDQIVRWLARTYGCPPDDLRVSFEESQAEFLDSSTDDVTVSIRSLGNSDKLSLAITTYRGDVITNSRTIRVVPLIRREVAVASRRINRGDTMNADTVSRDEQWVAPSVAALDPSAIQGVVARNRIDAGTILRPEHVEQPVVMKKGEIVTVDCVSGSVVVRAMARAMSPAKDGEVIAFQYLDSKRSFNARVNGPGRAVLVAATDPLVAEAPVDGAPQQAILPNPRSHSKSKLASAQGD